MSYTWIYYTLSLVYKNASINFLEFCFLIAGYLTYIEKNESQHIICLNDINCVY